MTDLVNFYVQVTEKKKKHMYTFISLSDLIVTLADSDLDLLSYHSYCFQDFSLIDLYRTWIWRLYAQSLSIFLDLSDQRLPKEILNIITVYFFN